MFTLYLNLYKCNKRKRNENASYTLYFLAYRYTKCSPFISALYWLFEAAAPVWTKHRIVGQVTSKVKKTRPKLSSFYIIRSLNRLTVFKRPTPGWIWVFSLLFVLLKNDMVGFSVLLKRHIRGDGWSIYRRSIFSKQRTWISPSSCLRVHL